MTNEVKTIESFKIKNIIPAKVEAPGLDELVAGTDKMLKKYKEFPVSDENYDQAKKSRKELRDTIEDISTTRKNTEKEILVEWSVIKEKIMSIEKSGKAADKLMTSQMQSVENDRKEKRKQVVENEVSKIADENNIDVSRIQFNPKWVNVTYSHNDMVSEINGQIESLRKDDELRALQTSRIENVAGGFGVDASPYISMLNYRDLADIKAQIKRDVEIKQAKEDAKAAAKSESERKLNERVDNATKVGDKLIDEDGEVIQNVPENPKVFTRNLVVTGTKEQLKAVAKFMDDNGIKYGGK